MAVSVEWEVKATEFANCNCSYGCPCQFNGLPTHGNCRYGAGFQIEQAILATGSLTVFAPSPWPLGPPLSTKATARCRG